MNNINFLNPETIISANLLEGNLSTFEATRPAYNEKLLKNQNVQLVNNADEILKFQEEYFIEDSFTDHKLYKQLPKIISGYNGDYDVIFQTKLLGFVKAKDLSCTFKIPVTFYLPQNVTPSNTIDSLNLSNIQQSPFTFLNCIECVDCTIGKNKVSMFPQDTIRKNIRLMTLRKCLNEAQSKASLSTGLNCQRTSRENFWISSNESLYNQIYNINFYPFEVANTSYEHQVTLPLGTILPFFDNDYYLPQGFTFDLHIRFKCGPYLTLFGDTTYFRSQGLSYGIINSNALEWPIVKRSVYLVYDAFEVKQDLIAAFNRLPAIVINSTYLVEKTFVPNQININGNYVINLPRIIPPEKILLYFKLEPFIGLNSNYKTTKACVVPYNDDALDFSINIKNQNVLEFDSLGFFGGFQVKNIRVYINSILKYSSIENDQSILQKIQIGNDKYNVWDYTETYDEINLNNCRKDEYDIPIRLKLIDNIVPIQIPTNNSNLIQKNVRENLAQAQSFRLEFSVESDFQFITSPAQQSNGVRYTNSLPENTTIRLVFPYDYQLLYNKFEQELGTVSWPFVVKDQKIQLAAETQLN